MYMSLGFVWVMKSIALRNFILPGEVSFVLCVWALKLSQWWVSPRPWCSGVWWHDVSYTCGSEGGDRRLLHTTDARLHRTSWCHMPEHCDINSLCLILHPVIVCACNLVINLTINWGHKKHIQNFAEEKSHVGWLWCLCRYHYSLKMFTYERVRARNFARTWGFVQCSQAIPIAIGVPISGEDHCITCYFHVKRCCQSMLARGVAVVIAQPVCGGGKQSFHDCSVAHSDSENTFVLQECLVNWWGLVYSQCQIKCN